MKLIIDNIFFLYLEKKFQLINALKVLKLHITKTWPFSST